MGRQGLFGNRLRVRRREGPGRTGTAVFQRRPRAVSFDNSSERFGGLTR